jgi:hypothetical protein
MGRRGWRRGRLVCFALRDCLRFKDLLSLLLRLRLRFLLEFKGLLLESEVVDGARLSMERGCEWRAELVSRPCLLLWLGLFSCTSHDDSVIR